jgi:hypothetical protein
VIYAWNNAPPNSSGEWTLEKSLLIRQEGIFSKTCSREQRIKSKKNKLSV